MAKIVAIIVETNFDNVAENAALRDFCEQESIGYNSYPIGEKVQYHLQTPVDVDTVRSVLDAMADEIGLE